MWHFDGQTWVPTAEQNKLILDLQGQQRDLQIQQVQLLSSIKTATQFVAIVIGVLIILSFINLVAATSK